MFAPIWNFPPGAVSIFVATLRTGLLERREQDMSDEARKDMALQILHGRRFEEELEKWLKELRDEAFVDIRLGQT